MRTISGKKVLVTGGAGFIGSNIAHELCGDNEVLVLDDLSSGKKENLDGLDVELITASIRDADRVREAMEGVDYVFHHAAIASVPRSVDDPVSSNQVNVCGTLRVLVEARDAKVRKVVFASSSAIYGDTPSEMKREGDLPAPISPYAVTKMTGEMYCRNFWLNYGLPTCSLRYFNVYGPRQDPNSQYAAVIPRFMSRLMNDEDPEINGDGTQSRDFTYVDDVVDANIQAMLSSAQGVFNISGGTQVNLLELLDEMGRLLGKRPRPRFVAKRPGDVMHSLADISRAKQAFGYSPKIDLETGLKRTIEWFEAPSKMVITR